MLGLAPATVGWVDRLPRVGPAVTLLNRRAVTIYLWHMPVVVGLAAVLGGLGLAGKLLATKAALHAFERLTKEPPTSWSGPGDSS